MTTEDKLPLGAREAAKDFRDAQGQVADDQKNTETELLKMDKAFDTLIEEVELMQQAVKEAQDERDQAERIAYTIIPDMLKDVERGTHSLEEVIDRVKHYDPTR